MFSVQAIIPALFLVFILVAAHVNTESSEEDEKIMLKCMEEADVKIEDVQALRTDEVSEKMMCFMKCMYESDGMFNENGILIKEIMQESYDEYGWDENQRKQADNCLDKMTGVKECGDLSSFLSCIPVIRFGELID